MLFTVPRYVTTGGSGKIIIKRQRERKGLRAFSRPNSTETILSHGQESLMRAL